MGTEDRSEDGSSALPDCGDAIDPVTFEQILEMDDDEEREFSKQIVFDFFEQAQQTFQQMETAIEDRDLPKLGDRGHFLKGSSATLGLVKVKDTCEKIQNLGAQKDERGEHPQSATVCLDRIKGLLPKVKVDCTDAEKRLRVFYHETE